MKRFTVALTLCLTICLIYSLSRAQDEPFWKHIPTIKNDQTGEESPYFARDCYRFTDTESENYPKLSVKSIAWNAIKETVVEFDCKLLAYRTRIWIHKNGAEEKEKNLDWTEVVPDSIGEPLLEYACRDRSKEKR